MAGAGEQQAEYEPGWSYADNIAAGVDVSHREKAPLAPR